jgi:hypothetical protein
MAGRHRARPSRRGRSVILLLAGTLIGTMLLTPAGAHISDSVTHLWNQHIRPKTDALYEKKSAVLFAVVNADGSLGANKRALSAQSFGVGSGDYKVVFNRGVAGCAHVATIRDTVGGAGEITAEPFSGQANAVFVTSRTSTGATTDNRFSLVVICG